MIESQLFGSLSRSFDRAGRVRSDGRSLTNIPGDAGSGSQAFSYDALSRLTGSAGLALSRSYQYDLDGNRTSKVEGAVTTTYTYDRADQVANQVIGGTTRTFDYDRYGNLVSGVDNASAVTTYAYDEASRLTTISPPGGAATQVTFTLDALDRHATRLVNAALTDTYAYLDATETAWQTGAGTTTSALLDADGSRLALKTGSTVSWLVFDLHGSVVALCTAGGSTLSDAYRFDGFGQQIASAGSATNPYRYRGLLNIGSGWDSGALLDMGARDYSPQLGVFTQQDSVQGSAANPMTMNRFLYALANPATLIDPDGHAVWVLALAFAPEIGAFGAALFWGAAAGIAGLIGWNVVGPAVSQSSATTNPLTALRPPDARDTDRDLGVSLTRADPTDNLIPVDDLYDRHAGPLESSRGWGEGEPPIWGGKPSCGKPCQLFVFALGAIGTGGASFLLTGQAADEDPEEDTHLPYGTGDPYVGPVGSPSPMPSPSLTNYGPMPHSPSSRGSLSTRSSLTAPAASPIASSYLSKMGSLAYL